MLTCQNELTFLLNLKLPKIFSYSNIARDFQKDVNSEVNVKIIFWKSQRFNFQLKHQGMADLNSNSRFRATTVCLQTTKLEKCQWIWALQHTLFNTLGPSRCPPKCL